LIKQRKRKEKMKKFLITGGVLFAVLPAMALDLPSDLITANDSLNCSDTQNQEFANSHDSEHPLEMQAIYVKNACQSGQYLNVTGNTVNIDNSGNITNADCATCTAGYYCDGLSDITINDGQLQSSYGRSECPDGYTDGGTGVTSEALCSKNVDVAYCTSLNLCSNFNNIVTTGNDACSTSVNSNNSNIVNGTITYGNRGTEPLCIVNKKCLSGYTAKNVYRWVVNNSGRVVSYSNCSIDGQYGTSCNTMEHGTLVWRTDSNDTSAPFAELHLVAKCSALAPTNNVYHVADGTTGFDIPGQYCWLKVVDFPGQEWMIGGPGGQDQAECEATCGVTMASATYPFGNIDSQTNQYVVNPNAVFSLSAMADLTENGASANVCVANEITINWGVDKNEQNITTTCTYGEDFVAPVDTPKSEAGYKFIGWRVGTTNNNNQQP
jgi:hypothetical protein